MTTWDAVTYADWAKRPREVVEVLPSDDVHPYMGLHAALLGRLDRQAVAFELKQTPYGELRFESASFSLVYLSHPKRNFVYERTTHAPDGRRIQMLFDVVRGHLTLKEVGVDEVYLFTVNQWLFGRVRRIGADTVTVDVMLDITPDYGVPSPVLVNVENIETYVLGGLRDGTLSVNRSARLTNVAASTFSRLKNETQALRNIPLLSLIPMALLSDLLAFDASVEAEWSRAKQVSSGIARITVETADQVYTIDGENAALVDAVHARLLSDLSAAHVTLTGFVDGVAAGNERYPQVTLRTADIRRIYRTDLTKASVASEVPSAPEKGTNT